MYWLFDCRDRASTGKRALRMYPETPAGRREAWHYVVQVEAPADSDAYEYLDESEHDTFNEFWAEYGWSLWPMEDDAEVPADCVVFKKVDPYDGTWPHVAGCQCEVCMPEYHVHTWSRPSEDDAVERCDCGAER